MRHRQNHDECAHRQVEHRTRRSIVARTPEFVNESRKWDNSSVPFCFFDPHVCVRPALDRIDALDILRHRATTLGGVLESMMGERNSVSSFQPGSLPKREILLWSVH